MATGPTEGAGTGAGEQPQETELEARAKLEEQRRELNEALNGEGGALNKLAFDEVNIRRLEGEKAAAKKAVEEANAAILKCKAQIETLQLVLDTIHGNCNTADGASAVLETAITETEATLKKIIEEIEGGGIGDGLRQKLQKIEDPKAGEDQFGEIARQIDAARARNILDLALAKKSALKKELQDLKGIATGSDNDEASIKRRIEEYITIKANADRLLTEKETALFDIIKELEDARLQLDRQGEVVEAQTKKLSEIETALRELAEGGATTVLLQKAATQAVEIREVNDGIDDSVIGHETIDGLDNVVTDAVGNLHRLLGTIRAQTARHNEAAMRVNEVISKYLQSIAKALEALQEVVIKLQNNQADLAELAQAKKNLADLLAHAPDEIGEAERLKCERDDIVLSCRLSVAKCLGDIIIAAAGRGTEKTTTIMNALLKIAREAGLKIEFVENGEKEVATAEPAAEELGEAEKPAPGGAPPLPAPEAPKPEKPEIFDEE